MRWEQLAVMGSIPWRKYPPMGLLPCHFKGGGSPPSHLRTICWTSITNYSESLLSKSYLHNQFLLYFSANAVCRDLGFDSGEVVPRDGTFTGLPILLDEISCTDYWGYNLDRCEHAPWGQHDCTHEQDVGIRCCKCHVMRVGLNIILSYAIRIK